MPRSLAACEETVDLRQFRDIARSLRPRPTGSRASGSDRMPAYDRTSTISSRTACTNGCSDFIRDKAALDAAIAGQYRFG